jgi:hypothetical protein
MWELSGPGPRPDGFLNLLHKTLSDFRNLVMSMLGKKKSEKDSAYGGTYGEQSSV